MTQCTEQPPLSAEKLYKKYLVRWKMKKITAPDPTECQASKIRGQCSGIDKRVLTAKGRCKYHHGAECEEISRGWSMDLRSPSN
jgi:hypothetical protein